MVATFCLYCRSCVSAVLFGRWLCRNRGIKERYLESYAGTLLIYMQDDEAYLFLDTDKKPADLISEKEVVFQIKVETHDPQSPL